MSTLRGLYAVNLSQPELNDMERVYKHTVDKGINLLELKPEAAQQALASLRNLRGRVHINTTYPTQPSPSTAAAVEGEGSPERRWRRSR